MSHNYHLSLGTTLFMRIHMHRAGGPGNLETYRIDGKCNKQKIQCYFVEYQIYFTRKTELCDIITCAAHS